MSDTNANVGEMGRIAVQVAAEHTEYEAALQAERDAQAALMTAVISAVKPALRALSNRIRVSSRTWWPNNTGTATKDQHDGSGVYLRADHAGPSQDHPRSNEGAYRGTDYFLRPDGSIVRLTYSGTWSCWQGAASSWGAEVTPVSVADFASKDGRVAGAIEALSVALQAQLSGGKAAATQRARDRAAKLAALATLL